MTSRLTILVLLTILGCAPRVHIWPEIQSDIQIDLSGCVLVTNAAGGGSGAVVAKKQGWWYVITAAHVAFVDVDMKVDGHKAELYIIDPKYDLALVRFLSIKTYPIYPLARSSVGQRVHLVGYPNSTEGKTTRQRLFVQTGFISRINKNFIWYNGGASEGASGGPMLDAHGRIVGVISGIQLAGLNKRESMACGVPSRRIQELMTSLGR